jgi:outer membrane phospholipase A
MKAFTVILWIMLSTVSAFAGDLETIIAPPAETSQSGQPAKFSVYIHNAGKESIFVQLPVQVTCMLVVDDQVMEQEAFAVQPFPETPALVGKSGFVKARYSFVVPQGLEGPVRMQVREFEADSIMFSVTSTLPTETEVSHIDDAEPSEDYASLESLFTLYQPYLINIAAYEPMYFLFGTELAESKFQISFKYQFFNADNPLAKDHPWLQGLHFGYTQTSFWDLESNSAPFKDTSYKPEFFFLSSNINARPPWSKGFFVQTGFQHESNGRSGDVSRSTNYLYVKPIFILYDEKTRYGLQVAPKIWAYVNNDDDTNPDLEDYRGFFDLELKFGKADSFVLGSNLRWAEEGPSVQVDLTYPLDRLLFRNFDLFFQVQYVNALAESILDYRERNEALRLGFAIVR